jgi:hypothetical protein
MTIVNCENCGGTHIGTFKCPFTLASCVICGTPTIYACSDCAIEGKGSVHVCQHDPCRIEHERLNPQHPKANAITAGQGTEK